jgi:hypothetical protein
MQSCGLCELSPSARWTLQIDWLGDEGLLTVGTGPDHSWFDVYINKSFWQSDDGSTSYVIHLKQFDIVTVVYDGVHL